MMLTVLDEYFQQLFRMAEFCVAVWQIASHSSGAWQFLSTNISQGMWVAAWRSGNVVLGVSTRLLYVRPG